MSQVSQRKKRVLLAGVAPSYLSLFRENLGDEILIAQVAKDDTLTNEMVLMTDLVILGLDDGEHLANRFANIMADTTSEQMIYHIGGVEPSVELKLRLPMLRALSLPVNFDYLRGVLDSVQFDKAKIMRLDEEHNRLRALYEISSALLKVSDRMQIAPSLEYTLPQLLDASLILLVFPSSTNQIVFLHAQDPVGPARVKVLTTHLRDAWDVLRSDLRINWGFLETIANGADSPRDLTLKASSFMTTPISRGRQTEGFLTVLPRAEIHLDETFLQTFFVIGDLVSVLIQNLDLREELQRRATHDGLTGLFNRQTLIEGLEKECRRSQRYRQPVCVVMFDIDSFKQVNDRFGHQAGDEVLRVISCRLLDTLREIDVAGRAGGEEFICVLVNTDIEGGTSWAERFREIIASNPIYHEGREIRVTISLGVAVASGEDAIVDTLIGRADSALYDAKYGGKNRVIASSSDSSGFIPINRSWLLEDKKE